MSPGPARPRSTRAKADRAARPAAEALALTADTGIRADAIHTRGAVGYERTSPRADAELTLAAAALVRTTAR